MGDPDERARRARRRKRNIIAKEMFRQKKTEKVHLSKKDRKKHEEQEDMEYYDDETFDVD